MLCLAHLGGGALSGRRYSNMEMWSYAWCFCVALCGCCRVTEEMWRSACGFWMAVPRVGAIVLQGRCGALLRAFGWSALSGRYSVTEEMWYIA